MAVPPPTPPPLDPINRQSKEPYLIFTVGATFISQQRKKNNKVYGWWGSRKEYLLTCSRFLVLVVTVVLRLSYCWSLFVTDTWGALVISPEERGKHGMMYQYELAIYSLYWCNEGMKWKFQGGTEKSLPVPDYLHTALDTLSTPFPAPEKDKPENTKAWWFSG